MFANFEFSALGPVILFLPLFSSVILGFGGNFLGKRYSIFISIFNLFVAVFLSLTLLYAVFLSHTVKLHKIYTWMSSGTLSVDFAFQFDALTAIMVFVILFISLLVQFYSVGYMSEDPHIIRFMSYLSLFSFFMLLLVTSSNYVQLLFGWEGVGLVSYLLVNFWYTRLQANKSAIKAIILNRFGDLGLTLGILVVYLVFGTVDFSSVFALVPYVSFTADFGIFNVNVLNLIGILLFFGALGKSAQITLHMWLPDAMEGPTPVSALLHSATMVTAGVFLLLRSSPLVVQAPLACSVIAFFGFTTAVFASLVGAFQHDIKKVIAYSTCSQLGYMVFCCGIGAYSYSLCHLVNHAFFKALLFLCSGVIIHALGDEQDMRKMGGLAKLLPFTYTCMLFGTLALIGFPFFSGFYSKDVILEVAFINSYFTFSPSLGFTVLGVAAFWSSFYSLQLLYLVFFGEMRVPRARVPYISDASFHLGLPLFILTLLAITSGYYLEYFFVVYGESLFTYSFPQNAILANSVDIEGIYPSVLRLVPTVVSILGAVTALAVCESFSDLLYLAKRRFSYLFSFNNDKWSYDLISVSYIVSPSLVFSYWYTYVHLDKGLLELFGPYGLYLYFNRFNGLIKQLHSGFLVHYGLLMLASVVLILALCLLMLNFSFTFELMLALLVPLSFLPLFNFTQK